MGHDSQLSLNTMLSYLIYFVKYIFDYVIKRRYPSSLCYYSAIGSLTIFASVPLSLSTFNVIVVSFADNSEEVSILNCLPIWFCSHSSLHLCSSLMNFLIFLLSTDYILSHTFMCLGLPTSTTNRL